MVETTLTDKEPRAALADHEFLSKPHTPQGKLICQQIIQENQAETASLGVKQLITLYVGLEEYKVARVNLMGDLIEDWVDLVQNRCRAILAEPVRGSEEESQTLQRLRDKLSESDESFEALKRIKSGMTFDGLNSIISNLLKEEGIKISPDKREQIEGELAEYYKQNPQIRDEIREILPVK